MKIPLSKIDIDDKITNAVGKVLQSGHFILGKETKRFEEKFAEYCGVRYAACVSSGTAALFLTLKSLGIKTGDEVIVPSLSFFSSASAIAMTGAKPKFIDVSMNDYTLDYSKIKKNISKKTKAIMPVHIYGHPCNMDEILKIANNHKLKVIEDAAQSHGAKYKNKKIGSLGLAACFSFYPSKNLTVCGDGGIVTSNSKKLIESIKILRNHGRTQKYFHEFLGYNLRFNEIQASIGSAMLDKLDDINIKRRNIAKKYSENIIHPKIIKPSENKNSYNVYHLYTVRTKSRNKLQSYLKSKGIETGIHYPIPIHKQPVFSEFNSMSLPVTEEICSTTLSLPMFPSLNNKQIEYIIKCINNF